MATSAEATLGPLFISLIFDVMFLGMIATQTFVYFSRYYSDKLWLRSFVVFLILANIVNSAFNITFTYLTLVTHYADPISYTRATWVFASGPALTALIAFTVELFLTWRATALTQDLPSVLRWFAIGAALCCSVGQVVGGFGVAIAIGADPVYDGFERFRISCWSIVWIGCTVVGNVLIVGLTIRHFHNNRGNFLHSGPKPDRLITALVQNGLSLAVCTIVQFGLYFLQPTGHRLTHTIPLSKLYAATVLVTLNAREGWNWPESYLAPISGSFGSANGGGQMPGLSNLSFAANPALATSASVTKPETVVLRPIVYEAHEMNAMGSGGIKLERVRDMEWVTTISDNTDEVKYKF